jgi:D-psicose/D-tagatose/L-ribulose 3-epimerase
MKFGVNTLIWSAAYDSTVEDLLPTIKSKGFDGIEIPIFRPDDVDVARVRRGMEANGLEPNVASVFVDGLSLISADREIRRKSVERLRSLIAVTAEVGATCIAGPLYSPVGYLPGRRRTADEWAWAVEGLQQVGDVLTDSGVTLAIEPLNRFETFFLNTAADAAALADEVAHPSIGILYDTFHANVEEKNIAEGLLHIGKHVKLIHTCENDRGTPGTGHVEWSEVFAAIRAIEYDGWLTIESFGSALRELSAAAAIWRDIETDPASIAYDGVRFLRQGLGMIAAQ